MTYYNKKPYITKNSQGPATFYYILSHFSRHTLLKIHRVLQHASEYGIASYSHTLLKIHRVLQRIYHSWYEFTGHTLLKIHRVLQQDYSAFEEANGHTLLKIHRVLQLNNDLKLIMQGPYITKNSQGPATYYFTFFLHFLPYITKNSQGPATWL